MELNTDRIKFFFDQLNKCETAFQAGVYSAIFQFFPTARVEQQIFDADNNIKWRFDIVIDCFWLELDGIQHRYDDVRFNLDEKKDTFAFKNGKFVFRRSNSWWNNNWRIFPQMLILFMNNIKEELFDLKAGR